MFLLWLACRSSSSELVIVAPAAEAPVLASFVAATGDPRLRVVTKARGGRLLRVELGDLARGAYRLESDGRDLVVTGGGVLGAQFGLAAALEAMGFRFVHPQHTRIPDVLELPEGDGATVTPDLTRNGLHLHTLHPIEAYYDLWEPSAEGLARAEQLVDWVVKNRGDHVQWPLLDPPSDPVELAAWQDHTAKVIALAHARDVTVGAGVQLLGTGSLQNAFVLLPNEQGGVEDVDAALAPLAPFALDEVDLSFGEFLSSDPEVFLSVGNLAVERIGAAFPGVDVATTIHVGAEQRVEYNGEDLLYYFLGTYLEGAFPRIHTVMYYNLFDDAGGAYEHEEFDEHRAYLLDALASGERVGYHPESAYWVAFDNSVPTFLPVYAKSRFIDFDQIAAAGGQPLQDHALFSSGGEWGYWLGDALTLRMGHQRPASWDEPVRELFSGWGADGDALASAVVELGDLQHQALIVDRLAPYLAGRDALIDLADTSGIYSQPDRPRIDEADEWDAATRQDVEAAVAGLDALADATEALLAGIADLQPDDPVFAELRDGFEIDVHRARFAARVHEVALAGPGAGEEALGLAQAELDAARVVVARRHGALWWSGGDRLIADDDVNDTIYKYGYLWTADTLCYWDRERIQATNVTRGEATIAPACL